VSGNRAPFGAATVGLPLRQSIAENAWSPSAENGWQCIAENGWQRIAESVWLCLLKLRGYITLKDDIWYRYARLRSDEKADQAVARLRGLGVEVIAIDWPLTRQAAAYKKSGGLSFADCYAAAVAKAWNAALVTGDPEFKRLEKEVEIRWLRRK
jgi:predicted nucleic acid-binding protein